MMRNFGLINSGRLITRANHQPPARAQTPRDPMQLPSGSIHGEPIPARERATLSLITIFLSLMFAVPFLLAAILLHFH